MLKLKHLSEYRINLSVCFIESFEVLMMATIKIMVSRDVTSCSLEYVSEDSASICSVLEFSYVLKLEAAGSCKTLVALYQTTWNHIPEDHNLHSFIVSVTCTHVCFICFLFYDCVIL